MNKLQRKQEIFQGFDFDFFKGIYFNSEKKKIFSREFVYRTEPEELKSLVDKEEADWEFYFMSQPKPFVMSALLEYIRRIHEFEGNRALDD